MRTYLSGRPTLDATQPLLGRPGHAVHIQHRAAAFWAQTFQRKLPQPQVCFEVHEFGSNLAIGQLQEKRRITLHLQVVADCQTLSICFFLLFFFLLPIDSISLRPRCFLAPNSWACVKLCIFLTSLSVSARPRSHVGFML